MEMYEVGGCVRDEILGYKSKDIDFSVVLEEDDFNIFDGVMKDDPFGVMVQNLREMCFEIFLETPEHFTVRAQFPKGHPVILKAIEDAGGNLKAVRTVTADFVLARKDGEYSDGRRPDSVELGTLHDDLARRDFTMNAIAKATDGTLIDPFNGRKDIEQRLIRAVGDPKERLREDALRAVRALRFSLTKGMRIEGSLQKVLLWEVKIADERIAEELSKMFRYDTRDALKILHFYPALTDAMLCGKVSLDATLKQKGRGR
jgi:tRNA nucleotidyltransferase/poly(A) polymerase